MAPQTWTPPPCIHARTRVGWGLPCLICRPPSLPHSCGRRPLSELPWSAHDRLPPLGSVRPCVHALLPASQRRSGTSLAPAVGPYVGVHLRIFRPRNIRHHRGPVPSGRPPDLAPPDLTGPVVIKPVWPRASGVYAPHWYGCPEPVGSCPGAGSAFATGTNEPATHRGRTWISPPSTATG